MATDIVTLDIMNKNIIELNYYYLPNSCILFLYVVFIYK